MKIAFIGGGAMGEAIIKCLLVKKVATPQDIVVSDISSVRRELLGKEYGINTLTDNREAVTDTNLVILAVKPQNLSKVLEEIKGLDPKQLLLSIVAGTTLSSLCQGLNHSCVIRAMPNMPAQIGEGMTIWTATDETKQRQKELAQTVLGALGREIYVDDEKYLNMATALSGSGPAYIFLFIESLTDAGVHLGLSRNTAQELVIHTILGSTHMVVETGKQPAALRNMVTSPGGITTEALLQLEKGKFRALIIDAVAAAYKKAERF